MAKRRELNIFSLSFLDIMSCGFGAVILIFVVINNASQELNPTPKTELLAKIKKIEEEILSLQALIHYGERPSVSYTHLRAHETLRYLV